MLAMSTRASLQQQLGALLLLDARPEFDLPAAERLLAERMRAVPRLRQRLVRTPPGAGGPLWLDDPGFDVRRHVGWVRCPAPGDEQALLDLVATVIDQALPRDRPQWSATFVTGVSGGRVALLVVLHHVLVDGIGGLAVLDRLVDPGDAGRSSSGRPFPQGRPSYARLVADATRAKARAVRLLPSTLKGLRGSSAVGGGLHPPRAAPCSLLGRTGSHNRFAVVRADVHRLHAAAHRGGGTVNDALLAAIAGALESVLERRGESVETLAFAVMVAARRSVTAEALGNAAAPLLVSVPTGGDGAERLRRIAGTVRGARSAAAGSPMLGVLGPLFRLLAVAGLYHWFIGHQHRFHSLVSNVPGPDRPLAYDGMPIGAIVPVSVGESGNVTVSFLALSYAGTLTVTVIADRDAAPDLSDLAAILQAELDALVNVPAAHRG
jgi:WS/DGAT/MGAT family acyltransferase